MSVQRSFAQRKNNALDLVPVMDTSGYWSEQCDNYLLKIDPTNCSVFNVDVTELDYYNVNYFNRITAAGYINDENSSNIRQVVFAMIVDPTIATTYPGLEFTVNFLNSNSNTLSIGIFTNATLNGNGDGAKVLSPIYGYLNGTRIQSLTLKSNGAKFVVVSSGPSPWTSGNINWC